MTYIVYRHVCTETGKSYIGFTKNSMEKRWSEHVSLAFRCYNHNPSRKYHFQNAIRKYGLAAWTHEVIQENIGSVEEACFAEIHWIAKLSTRSPEGYNETPGGRGVRDMSPAAKERHRLATKLALSDPDVRRRMCDFQKTAHNTPESKMKNSMAQKLAQVRPDVAEKKRRAMYLHRSDPNFKCPRSKPVLQLSLDGRVIARFESATEASKLTNTHVSHLCEVARGERKISGGFRWKYIDTIGEMKNV